MKSLTLFLCLTASSVSLAGTIVHDAVLMTGNLASGGSLIPGLEGKIMAIQLKGAKDREEFKLKMDTKAADLAVKRLKDRQHYLEKTLEEVSDGYNQLIIISGKLAEIKATLIDIEPTVELTADDAAQITRRQVALKLLESECKNSPEICSPLPSGSWKKEEFMSAVKNIDIEEDRLTDDEATYLDEIDNDNAELESIKSQFGSENAGK